MTDPTDTEALALARDFRDLHLTARALVRAAYLGDTAPDHIAAGKAALAAGLPALAAREALLAQQLDPGNPAALKLRSDATEATHAVRRAQAQQGSAFVAALYLLLYRLRAEEGLAALLLTPVVNPALESQLGADIVREPGSVCALDIISATLAGMGAGGIEIRGDDHQIEGITRCQLRGSKASAAELLAKIEAEGTPCENCGAPRWTFAADDDLGTYCSSCAWPHPVAALAQTRKRKTIAQLEADLAASQAETAAAKKATAAALDQVKGLEGKIAKLAHTAQGEAGMRRRLLGGGPEAASAEEMSLEDLQAAARGAADTAAAAARRADELVVAAARKAGQP
jgi:hypothetical protein